MRAYIPEKKRKKKRFQRKLTLFLFLGLLVLVLSGLTYWVVFSSFWQVRGVEITGLSNLEHDTVNKKIRSVVSERWVTKLLGIDNYWSWSSGRLAINNWPLLADIHIEKSVIKRTVLIDVVERKGFGIWCIYSDNIQHCYWFDEDAIAFDEAPRPEGRLITTIDEEYDYEVKIGEPLLAANLWKNLRKILDSWLIEELSIYRLVVDRERQELVIEATPDFRVYVSLRFEPENNLMALKKIVDEGRVELEKLNYVDLRVENKLYYK